MTRLVLSGLILAYATGCASLPPAPSGNTCVGDVPRGGFDCVPIQAAVRRGEVKKRDASSFVPFKAVDNWIAFDPETWANIQTYIGDLKLLAKKQCNIP